MRFINLDDLTLPEEWLDRAKAATKEVRDAHANQGLEAAREVVKRRSGLWSELSSELKLASNSKCWVCEQVQSRSDMPVDHFRPKNAVYECPSHPGYWWLAFAWENYRLSCVYCNSRRVDVVGGTAGGKQTHFPLVAEGVRASDETSAIEFEEPLLLDPTRPTDPGLLFFDDRGEALPHPRASPRGSLPELRATVSIEMYHLNHRGITEERKRLNNQLRRALLQAVRNLAGFQSGQAEPTANFDDALRVLAVAVSPRTALSASAIAYLKGRRADRDEVETVLSMVGV